MRQEIDIDNLMADTWLTVTLLRYGSPVPDGDALYNHCCAQVEAVRDALQQAGYDDASIAHISYAQCALLDETVMNRKPAVNEEGEIRVSDEGYKAWRSVPLQARYFGSLNAGEVIWDRIAAVLRQPAPLLAVLICYHRVLSLGFQGLYGVKTVSQTQREETLKALSARVPPLQTDLSLIVRGAKKRRFSLLRSVGFWIVLSVTMTGIVWWCGHLWLQALLSAQLGELH
ncbi:type VI secretion system protein TssL, short form [Cronobacter dublinensis]|uniref:type VI secretion system protein TssL, short form n=1 Tax=Cronobacter dublinensis TaxID=413497 RepID=UPI0024C3C481|nr:type VI secretion system protein TssL, short form [Cronobacter dublinensis]MDK1197033.1 type VI secretion system protein TssL, short form [Cronobacter dublinensis]